MKRQERQDTFEGSLLRNRQIYLEGDIEDRTAEHIGKAIIWLNAKNPEKKIFLFINSGGGSVLPSLDIYDVIKNSAAPVVGRVFRRANSMATVILQACNERQIMEHAEVWIHNIRLSVNEEWTSFKEVVAEKVVNSEKLQNEIYRLITNRSGISLEELKKLSLEKGAIPSKRALELGLVDKILKK
jgi:ATP-dependent Clp protease protease subunit